MESKRCGDGGCQGEGTTRSTEFSGLVPANPAAIVFEVSFGRCGDLKPIGTTAAASWPVRGLDPGACYSWQITVTGECGRTPGPVWSFTTSGTGEPIFKRGDASADGLTDLSDAVFILLHLFAGGPEPGCAKSADNDDDGRVDLTDAIALLLHLFASSPAPPDPFLECGPDPTPDDLTCRSPTGCG